MGTISALWDSGVLGAMATMAVTTLGQFSALNNQKFTTVLETLQKQQSSDSAVHDSAFARSSDKGVVVRRIMLFMAFFVLAVCPFIFAFSETFRLPSKQSNNLEVGSGGLFQKKKHSQSPT